jgi:Fe-S cluster assembly iron-binding protein IscA
MPPAGGEPSLAMAFVPEAEPGDQVMEKEGMTAYVAPEVADALEDATIDVSAENGMEQLVVNT